MQGKMLFAMQATVSGSALFFSIAMLTLGRDPAVYLPILTAVLGFWLPNPKLKAGDKAGAPDPAAVQPVSRAEEEAA